MDDPREKRKNTTTIVDAGNLITILLVNVRKKQQLTVERWEQDAQMV
jgi:hypothetical protein